MPPDSPSEEEKLEELPQDNGQTPFQAAAPSRDDTVPADDDDAQSDASKLDDTHPVTDTNVDPQELYDEGVAGAAEAHEPNPGNAVEGYNEPEQNIGSPS